MTYTYTYIRGPFRAPEAGKAGGAPVNNAYHTQAPQNR